MLCYIFLHGKCWLFRTNQMLLCMRNKINVTSCMIPVVIWAVTYIVCISSVDSSAVKDKSAHSRDLVELLATFHWRLQLLLQICSWIQLLGDDQTGRVGLNPRKQGALFCLHSPFATFRFSPCWFTQVLDLRQTDAIAALCSFDA